MGEWSAIRVGEQLYEQDGSEGSDGQLICGRDDEQHKGKVFDNVRQCRFLEDSMGRQSEKSR